MLRDNVRNPQRMRRSVEVVAGAHQDQHGRYTHEMSNATGEASARALIRIVPLVYGGVLGALAGHIVPGMALGMALCVALDLRMGSDSLSRPLLSPLLRRACPVMADIVRRLARRARVIGLRLPAVMRQMKCPLLEG